MQPLVYVHEEVLGIPRHQAHQALRPQCRKERIKDYLKKGAQLKDWSVWTALETYLQVTGKSVCVFLVQSLKPVSEGCLQPGDCSCEAL